MTDIRVETEVVERWFKDGVPYERVRYVNPASDGHRKSYNRKTGNTQKRYLFNKGSYNHAKIKRSINKAFRTYFESCLELEYYEGQTKLISLLNHLDALNCDDG